jgi:hypothetical protein
MQLGGWVLGLFGGAAAAPGLGAAGRIALYRSSLDNAEREVARIRREPALQRDIARLDRAIAKAKTPEELFKDPEAVRVLLQGLGLADQAENVGLARAALTSDPADPKSLAARLPDRRWKAAAEQLGFARTGLLTLRSEAIRETIRNGLVEYRRLTAIGQQSQAVADALYLRRMPEGEAPGIYEVLGDKVLRRVAQRLTGLPEQLALQSVEAQARSLQGRIRLEDFADPARREKLIQRYLAMAEDGGGSSAGLSLSL